MNKIVFIQCSDFPYKISAANEKILLIAKVIKASGNDVCLLSKNCTGFGGGDEFQDQADVFEGIKYVRLAKIKKNKGFLVDRILCNILSLLNEMKILYRFKSSGARVYLIISFSKIPAAIYYYLLSHLFSFTLIVNYMEWHVEQKGIKVYNRLNAHFFDRCFPRYIVAALPISDFIYNRLSSINPNLYLYKIPILVDYSKISSILSLEDNVPYFLYCGSTGYIEIIEFIVSAFQKFHLNNKKVTLRLVLSGKDNKIVEISNYYSQKINSNKMKIFSNIEYPKLIQMYKGALGLLIPLRPSIQDRARFPHKIGEYLASGRPIITNEWGEAKLYFKNLHNAFVLESYDIIQYSKAMQFIADNKEIADQVGQRGKETAKSVFDYVNFAKPVSDFLDKLPVRASQK